jgi:Uncharacterised protein family (UPF0220)
VHVTFADWVPGLCSLFGILIANLIDKDRVRCEERFGDSRALSYLSGLLSWLAAWQVAWCVFMLEINLMVDWGCAYRLCWC